MTRKLLGLLAAFALVGSGAALAGGDYGKGGSGQEELPPSEAGTGGSETSGDSALPPESSSAPADQSGVGGSGQEGAADQSGVILDEQPGTGGSGSTPTAKEQKDPMMGQGQMQQNGGEISGKIVKRTGKTIFVDHMGLVVPVEIASATKFDDPKLKKAADLKKGDEVKLTVEVKNETQNVAQTVSVTSGTGGSGEDSGLDSGSSSEFEKDSGKGGSGESGLEDDSSQQQDMPSDTPDESGMNSGEVK